MIIDYQSQLDYFRGRKVFLYPVLEDSRLHMVANKIIAFVLVDVENKQTYSISKEHPDGIYHHSNLDFLEESTVYCYDIAFFKQEGYDTTKFIDVQFQYYLKTNQACNFETPQILKHYARYFPKCEKSGVLVSLQKHEEIAFNLFREVFVEELQSGLAFYQSKLLNVFTAIEKNGLKIDEKSFTERFGETFSKRKDFCYTHYNFYTTTGRPSNRFGGINFAALNKEDDTRECFISRYGEDGTLVEIDFNSYHPRLIAAMLEYDFNGENVYEHLAKHFNQTQTPTQEQIGEAKELTFRQLYGGVQKQYMHVPFLNATNSLAYLLWKEANETGYIQSPISERKLILSNYQDINCYTLFNYYIQMFETETNVLILEKLLEQLVERKCLPILYTYDSILFDVHKTEIDYLLQHVLPTVIDQKQFPIKTKTGVNYRVLK
jgi:hypothetical protein